MDPLIHRRLALVGALHVQHPHQRLDGDALQEHGEVDDRDGGRHEHRLQRNVVRRDEEHQGEGDRTAKACHYVWREGKWGC